MKRFFFIFLFFSALHKLQAQKKQIDIDAIKEWPTLSDYAISDNGAYVWYSLFADKVGSTLFVGDALGKQKKEYKGGFNAKFSSDSKYILFEDDSALNVVRLADFEKISYNTTKSWAMSANALYFALTQKDSLKVGKIGGDNLNNLGKAEEYWFSPSGQSLCIKYLDSLVLIDISAGKSERIYSKGNVKNIAFDKSGKQVLFSIEDNNGVVIFKYSVNAKSASLLLSDSIIKKTSQNIVVSSSDFSFDGNGDRVFFKYRISPEKIYPDSDILYQYVDFWNYKDKFLQSHQKYAIDNKEGIYNPDHLFQGVVSLKTANVILLESLDTTILQPIGNNLVISKSISNEEESYWREEEWPGYKLVSLASGGSINFLDSKKNIFRLSMSPFERFITWLDTTVNKYFCYDIENKRKIELTNGVYTSNQFKESVSSFFIEGWLSKDQAIIANDGYDLWQIDPEGKKKSICLTSKYGVKSHIIFKPIDAGNLQEKGKIDELILAGLSDSTFDNGFFRITLSSENIPKQLLFGPYLYYFPDTFAADPPRSPIKAKLSNVYIFQRQSDAESPNVFVTHDFKNLLILSSNYPERRYRWFHSELVTWKTSSGESRRGILYIQDSLNAKAKIPILFNYYEIRSPELHKFHKPGLSANNINIPFYINRGYSVFVPDIPRKTFHPMENALETIESGANFITSKYKWIDKQRMGIQGQSFGGTITNYVATHSRLFAAAQSISGRSDYISSYNGTGFGGRSLQPMTEYSQNSLGSTPWDRPDIYIKNSAIFGVGQAVTPLLMVHGSQDQVVNISQSIELFNALRRAKKKVWLLQYAYGHVMSADSDLAIDFCTRQLQFFDHYLKDKPAPQWMVEGIPAKYKGIKSGLRLESLNRIP